MNEISVTNQWQQVARQQLTQLRSSSISQQFGAQAAWLLVFDQLLCAALVEISECGAQTQATTVVAMLESMSTADKSRMSVKQLQQWLTEPGAPFYEFCLSRNRLLTAQPTSEGAVRKQQVIASTNDSENKVEQFSEWLKEFDGWLESAREFGQEY